MSIINKGIYDSTIITWFLKYYYNCPRPVQIDKEFKTQMPTEESPSYPSILSVISAVVSEILSYYFPEEKAKLQGFSEEAANSKVLSGVNFKSDVVEGIKLGKQIGNLIIGEACKEKDLKGNYVDIKIKKFLNAPITKR